MNLTYLFGLLGGLLVLAFVANRLFRWTRIPDVVVLMATGVVIGPVLGWAHPEQFKEVTHAFGTLALILILFEGGLDLNIRETLSHFPGGLLFGVFAYALSTFSVGFVVSASYGISRADGLLAGAVVGCTSSTIVLPVLQQWKSGKAVKIILLLESTLGDILGVLTVGFLIGSHRAGHSAVGDFLTGFFSQVAISLGVSFLIGLAWSRLLPYLSEQQFWAGPYVFDGATPLRRNRKSRRKRPACSIGLRIDTLSTSLRGRRELVPTIFSVFAGRGADARVEILNFTAELSFLVRTFFFVLIGVVVELSGSQSPSGCYCWELRPPFFWRDGFPFGSAAGVGADWARRTAKKFSGMLPRGLITIVLALEVVEVRGQSMAFLSPMAFAVILATNLILVFGSVRTKKMAGAEAESSIDSMVVGGGRDAT